MGYVKQAHIEHGPQQVNKRDKEFDNSLTRENENQKNDLLEHNDGNRMDTGTTGETISDDSAMETVGAVNGTEDKERKSGVCT